MLDREALLAETKKCIRCGLCQAVCPSYQAIRNEAAVARGRNRLLRELAEGNLTMSPRLKEDMFACLGCEACQASCPAGVKTPEIVAYMRSEYVAKDGLPFVQSAILRKVLPHPQRLKLAAKSFRLGQIAKIAGTVAKSLPQSLKGRYEVIPETLPEPLETELPKFAQDAKVAYYLSCTTNYLNPSLGRDTLKVLAASGHKAAICLDTVCCGKPQNSLGDQKTARQMAIHNIEVLSKLNVEAIVTDCATCGSALKEYPHWLKGHPLAEKAQEVAAKVYDIGEFLVKKGFVVGAKKKELTITYHDPCHLIHAQGVKDEPRTILKSLPGVNFVESADADRCCGGAGSFCLTHQEISERILEPKVEGILATNPDMVATGCPMCKIQLQYGLRKTKVQVMHPVELLARTYE